MEMKMTRTRKIVLGTVGLAALLGGVAAASAHRGGWGHGGHGARHAAGGGFGGGGGGALGFLASGRAVCNGRGAEMADVMAVRLEYRLNVTDAQKPALDDLKAAIKTGVGKIAAACPKRPEPTADGTPRQRPTAPERLANLEAGLAARLDAVRGVRPAAEKFYASLSDEQKTKLSEMGEKRRGWGRHGPDRGDRGRGGPGGGDRSDGQN